MSKLIVILTFSVLLARATPTVERDGISKTSAESAAPILQETIADNGNIEVLGAPSSRSRTQDASPPVSDTSRWRRLLWLFRHKKSFVLKATDLTAADEKFVTDEHNRKRSEVKPVASDMLKLEYDRGLADLAKSYSQKCVYEHSKHPHTAKFDWPGENIFISTKVQTNLTKALDRAAHLWFDEGHYYSWKKMEGANHHVVGHYTQMVWASNYAIGCGATTCGNVNFGGKVHRRVQLVVCYYGPGGNYRDEHPYLTGPPCAHCPPHKKCVCEGASSHHSVKK